MERKKRLEELLNDPKLTSQQRENLKYFDNKNKALNVSTSSRYVYVQHIYKLTCFLEKKDFKKATEQDILKFWNQKRDQYEKNTLKTLKNALLKFYRILYNYRRGKYPPQVEWLQEVRIEVKIPKLREEEMLSWEDVENMAKHTNNVRDKALIFSLRESGGRINELLGYLYGKKGLLIKDLIFDEYGAFITLKRKREVVSRIRLVKSVPYLKDWLKYHPTKNPDDPLWATFYDKKQKRWRAMHENTLRDIIRKLAKKAGITKTFNPQFWRKSALTEMAHALSDSELEEYAGWAPGSKQKKRYIHVRDSQKTDAKIIRARGGKIELKEEKSSIGTPNIICPHCNRENVPDSLFCALCGLLISEKAEILVKKKAVSQEVEQKKIREEIAELREIVEKLLKNQ